MSPHPGHADVAALPDLGQVVEMDVPADLMPAAIPPDDVEEGPQP